MTRIWWELDEPVSPHEEAAMWVHDGQVDLPYYLARMELGDYVADYMFSPAEEQTLEDMILGMFSPEFDAYMDRVENGEQQ